MALANAAAIHVYALAAVFVAIAMIANLVIHHAAYYRSEQRVLSVPSWSFTVPVIVLALCLTSSAAGLAIFLAVVSEIPASLGHNAGLILSTGLPLLTFATALTQIVVISFTRDVGKAGKHHFWLPASFPELILLGIACFVWTVE